MPHPQKQEHGGKVMSTEVITATKDTPLEEAARIMADRLVGGLPVIKGKAVVGMITQTDLFHLFLEMLGARESGLRVTALVKEEPGMLACLTKAIDQAGGNIIALSTFAGESTEDREVTLKVNQMDVKNLIRHGERSVIKRGWDSGSKPSCLLRLIYKKLVNLND